MFIILGSLSEASDLIENTQFWKEAVIVVYVVLKNLNTWN